MLHWIWKFILGLVVGYVARIILPGAHDIGFWMTGILGVVGSLAGHGVAHMSGLESGEKPSGRIISALISLAGAALVIFVYAKFMHH
ncbi:MAG TPA: GlsB/YeaQ/YmgE family stress response membrane protein [Holophagaceae bacterium]|jgi:uncharacterized membrane protein YeaQ/YmgE (transglycosylase-associated protein family)|nr:GlsB/YeaQ/YmgE family stress response membrane protein [Holophagaceae bacterium]